MTVYAKTNPIGIDKKLLKIQNKLSELTWDNFDVYGKLYINQKNGEKIAEAFVGDGEYREVLIDDTKTAVFGFFIGDNRGGLNMIRVPVELVCSCRLDKIDDENERNDEEVLLTVLKKIKRETGLLEPQEREIKTGLSNVFNRVSIEKFQYRDMHPWFNFSIAFDLIYKNEI